MSIEARQLSFRYRHAKHWIFKNHNFRVARGQILAILGPNGRGKTTLLRCLQGTIRPHAGRVLKDGETAHVPQSIEAVFPFSARDMVIMGRARRLGLFGTP
ncbi:MAG: ABC transporter ATP-binding protein, partial [Pseudomonadota bacterium]